MKYIIVIGIVMIICLIYFLVMFNKFIRLKNRVNESFATMDVYLKKRWDLIPNLVEVVKGYSKHENETLKEIVSLRNTTYDDMTDAEKIATNKKVNSELNKIMLLAEAYPELKASTNFLNLSHELTTIEDEIAQSRKYYNAVVRDYNNKVEMIPSNLVAALMGLKTEPMFVASLEEREEVKVKLS